MSDPLKSQSKTGTRSRQMPTYAEGSESMRTAIPRLKQMLAEMLARDRLAAIESGLAALTTLR